jgi:hypothetical protein
LPPEDAFDTPANNMAPKKRHQNQNENNSNISTPVKKKFGKKYDAKDKSNAEAEKILNFTPTTKAVTIILGKET